MTRRRAPTGRSIPNNRRSGATPAANPEGAAPSSTRDTARLLRIQSSTRLMVSHGPSSDETAPLCRVSAHFRIPLPRWRHLLSGLLLVAFTTWGFIPPAAVPLPPQSRDHQLDLPLS